MKSSLDGVGDTARNIIAVEEIIRQHPHLQDKAEVLNRASEKIGAQGQYLRDRNREAIEQRNTLLTLIGRIQRSDGLPTKEMAAQIKAAQDEIEKIKTDCVLRNKQIEALPKTAPPFVYYEFIRDQLVGKNLKEDRRRVPQTTDPKRSLAESREKIGALILERGKRRHALLPKEVALANAYAAIDRKAAAVKLDFTTTTRMFQRNLGSSPQPGKVVWPIEYLETGTRLIERDNSTGMFYLFLRDQLKVMAKDQLDNVYRENPLVIPQHEREAKIAEIDAKILEESRVEEALVEVHEEHGLDVVRRPHAHPLAVLGLAIDVTPKPKPDIIQSDADTDDDDDFG